MRLQTSSLTRSCSPVEYSCHCGPSLLRSGPAVEDAIIRLGSRSSACRAAGLRALFVAWIGHVGEGAINDGLENRGEVRIIALSRVVVGAGECRLPADFAPQRRRCVEASDVAELSWNDLAELPDEEVYTPVFHGRHSEA